MAQRVGIKGPDAKLDLTCRIPVLILILDGPTPE
jgi:hypothetical protein